jgi:hypothetical protein
MAVRRYRASESYTANFSNECRGPDQTSVGSGAQLTRFAEGAYMHNSLKRKHRLLCQSFACFVILIIAANLRAQASLPALPEETFGQLLPNEGTTLVKGSRSSVSIAVTMSPSSTEAVEYVSQLTVNGRRFHRFATTLTPDTETGTIHASEILTWKVHVPRGRRALVELQFWGVGQSSGTRIDFGNLTRTYVIICNPRDWAPLKLVERLFGCCS